MHKFKKFKQIIDELNKLNNVVVRLSSDGVNGEIIEGENTSTIIPYDDTPTKANICEAYLNDGKCGTCRQCWNKSINVIAYVAHGQRMNKVLKEKGLTIEAVLVN